MAVKPPADGRDAILYETDVTRLLGLDRPVLQATQADLAAALAVGAGGGLGVLAAGPGPQAMLASMRAAPPAVHHRLAVELPVDAADSLLALLRADPPPMVIVPLALAGWARQASRLVLVRAGTVASARDAAAAGGDAVLATGHSAGSTLELVQAIAAALPDLPLVASGGLCDAGGLAAALAYGAGAIQLEPCTPADWARHLAMLCGAARPSARDSRQQREAAALRDNLRRRKPANRTAAP